MITDPIAISEIRSLMHQLRISEQVGDKDGAASLGWELANTLEDAGMLR